MKTNNKIKDKIVELTRLKAGTQGGKATAINAQIDILNWVLE